MSEHPDAVRPNYFANRGQIFQLAVQVIGVLITGSIAWPEIKVRAFSTSAIVFYALVVLVGLAVKYRNHPSIKVILLCVMVGAGTWEIENALVVKQRDAQIVEATIALKQRDAKIIEGTIALKQRDTQIEDLRKRINEREGGPAARVIPKPVEPQITIKREPIRSQRQAVMVSVKPSLAPNQIMQVWVYQGDYRWYPCLTAVQRPVDNFYSATCAFGLEALKDVVCGVSKFKIGALYSQTIMECPKDGLTDEEWHALPAKKVETPYIVFTCDQ
jgi:hypothetical protein